MQKNNFRNLNGFIAKITKAAAKGIKRDNTFNNPQAHKDAELKENSYPTANFNPHLGSAQAQA